MAIYQILDNRDRAELESLFSGGLKRIIVDTLPENGEETIIYMVPTTDSDENNIYEEYMFIEGKPELIGSTAIDFEALVGQKTEEGGEIFNDYENNKATGQYSFTQGSKTMFKLSADGTEYDETSKKEEAEITVTNEANQFAAHSEGGGTLASGAYSHAEGRALILKDEESETGYTIYKTTAAGKASHAEGHGTYAQAYFSHAEGWQTLASGNTAHAEGQNTIASGRNSHAEGKKTQATAEEAHAEGRNTVAAGMYSHAEGYQTKAERAGAHAEGFYTIASADAAHAEGFYTMASAAYSHAEGGRTNTSDTGAKGTYSHSEGQDTTAKGKASHAEGQDTLAQGACSHAEGVNTQALGNFSHAEGRGTIAYGPESHAEGYQTVTGAANDSSKGNFAHAEGYSTKALGQYSHAEGNNTVAAEDYQHVSGKFNSDNSTALFIIGNGTWDANRKNAFEVLKNGSANVQTQGTTNNSVIIGSTLKRIAGITNIPTDGTYANNNEALAVKITALQSEVETLKSDLETALDNIIAIQESLIGGNE